MIITQRSFIFMDLYGKSLFFKIYLLSSSFDFISFLYKFICLIKYILQASKNLEIMKLIQLKKSSPSLKIRKYQD